ncbi:MAG: YqeG family HAD IIIA-type phosphatase [Acutalibacteraceae bacterium]|jgi:HAD superfamily phosphatase (TIGR01668 family)
MSLFYPNMMLRRVQELSPEELRQAGIRGILLDVDNTLSPHGAPEPEPEALEWIKKMKREGFVLCVVSNNTEERVAPFAKKLGLAFSAMAGKPLPFGFCRAAAKLGLSRRQVLAVGDQLFTDICGANLAGIRSALVEPLEPEHALRFRLKRRLERPVLRRFLQKHPERIAVGCFAASESEVKKQ